MTTTSKLTWALVLLTLSAAAFGASWPASALFVAAVCLKVALTYFEFASGDFAARLAALEARPDPQAELARLAVLEARVNDPTNGIAEQLRQVRNITNFKGSR